jgi:hypothetical protein
MRSVEWGAGKKYEAGGAVEARNESKRGSNPQTKGGGEGIDIGVVVGYLILKVIINLDTINSK